MNSEVIKNFKLEITKEEPEDSGQTDSEIYIFECKNCQKKIKIEESVIGSKIIDPLRVDFDLSAHLMQCEFIKIKAIRNDSS